MEHSVRMKWQDGAQRKDIFHMYGVWVNMKQNMNNLIRSLYLLKKISSAKENHRLSDDVSNT